MSSPLDESQAPQPSGGRSEALALLRANPVQLDDFPTDQTAAQAFRQAAAVLVSVKEPEALNPAIEIRPDLSAPVALRSEFAPASVRAFQGSWVLKTSVRKAALAELDTAQKIRSALEANPSERSGRVQEL